MSEIIKRGDQPITTTQEVVTLHTETKKMRVYTVDDWEILGVEVTGLGVLVGVKDVSAQEVIFILDFLKKEGRDVSWSELKHAFRLNLSGKLENKVEHYGSLINYVGGILTEYRKYRQKHLIRAKEKSKVMTEDEKKHAEELINKEVFDELNKRYQEGKRSFDKMEGVKYYNCLKYYNLMIDYKEKAPQDAKELWIQARDIVTNKHKGHFDLDSRMIVGYLRGVTDGLSDELRKKVYLAQSNEYKGLLLSKFINGVSEMFDDLNELRE